MAPAFGKIGIHSHYKLSKLFSTTFNYRIHLKALRCAASLIMLNNNKYILILPQLKLTILQRKPPS